MVTDVETEWFQAHERVRQKRNRNLHSVLGPNDMTATDGHQMLMDVISLDPHLGHTARRV